MYYYFSSTHPAVIKLNGIFYGQIFNTVKYIDIGSPSCFVEICPVNSLQSPIGFFVDDKTLSSPPPFLSVTDMKGGYLVKYTPKAEKKDFNIISQAKFPNALVTLFTENGFKLSIETAYGVYTENFVFPFERAEILPFYNDSNYILTVLYGEKVFINVYAIKENTTNCISFSASEFNLEDYTATTFFPDMAKHVLTEKLTLDKEVKKEKISIKAQKKLSVYDMNEMLVPYAMLEELLVGGNVKPYLSDTVLENADKLPSFFGEYIGVMPPPFFREEKEVGLIYKQTENKYYVEYFTFTYQDKKISGIKKI